MNAMGGVDRVCEERAHNDILREVFPANPAALWDGSQQHAQASPADNDSKKQSVGDANGADQSRQAGDAENVQRGD
jgi:hypothetical protein